MGKTKKNKSYIFKALNSKEKVNTIILITVLIGAFILDILRILKNLLVSLLLIGLSVSIIAGIIIWIKLKPYYTEYNDFAKESVLNSTSDTFKTEESSYIFDSSGNIITKLRGSQDSTYMEYTDIPTTAVDAFVAVEDRTFWDNIGIDIKGLIRVGVGYLESRGDEVHGASTITQQLARNIFLTHEVSLERKFKEMLIAIKITEKYSKRDIMEYYINNICYANAFYGLEAAANGYFNKTSNELTLSETVYLCAIPNSPEYYNPYKYTDRAIKRRDKILNDMLELKLISNYEYNKAIKEEIVLEKPSYEFNDYQTTYAVDCAVRYLMELDGYKFTYKFDNMEQYSKYKEQYSDMYESTKQKLITGGYRIYTSLDNNVQQNVQETLNKNLEFDTEIDETTGAYALQGAVTVLDNDTGKVIAIVGGRSQEYKEKVYSLNRAYQSNRQPGSSIKPLVVYGPALVAGYNPNTTVFNIDVTAAKQKGVDVQSLSGQAMTLRNALEQSKNGVAWQVFDNIGADFSMWFLNEMKFASICPNDYYNSASLGGLTYGVTTVEMAGAYSALENHGYFKEPTCIVKILDSEDNNIYKQPIETAVYDERSADNLVDMMTGVLKVGTASKLKWYSNTKTVAACKTGTTNKSKDGWLCGFTPYYTVAVWVGYDQPRAMSSLYGATYPGSIWKQTMLSLIADKEEIEEFEKAETEYSDYEDIIREDLPEHAYSVYLEGRDDSEELSSGYTVYDFRKDRVIGEDVQYVINQINTLNIGDENIPDLYAQGCAIISTIYSNSYIAEIQTKLDEAYNNKIGQ